MEQQVDLSSAFLTNWRSSRREEAADLHTTEAENDLTRYNRGWDLPNQMHQRLTTSQVSWVEYNHMYIRVFEWPHWFT